jgi:hypothetical protein
VSGIAVEVLHTETCATWRATAQRIRELAAGDALAVELEVSTIETLD